MILQAQAERFKQNTEACMMRIKHIQECAAAIMKKIDEMQAEVDLLMKAAEMAKSETLRSALEAEIAKKNAVLKKHIDEARELADEAEKEVSDKEKYIKAYAEIIDIIERLE